MSKTGITFDLVSDLHLDYWEGNQRMLDWKSMKSADIMVVAGDISRDHREVIRELKRLSRLYKHVVFIDGNHEHKSIDYLNPDLAIAALKPEIDAIDNVTFLREEDLVIDGVAVIGRNGWWDYALAEPVYSAKKARKKMLKKMHKDIAIGKQISSAPSKAAIRVFAQKAKEDAENLQSRIAALQERDDVHSIIVVTHTVPHHELLDDNMLRDKGHKAARRGSAALAALQKADRKNKICGWIFGHQHHTADKVIGGIRYLAHPRGKPHDCTTQHYKPLTLTAGPEGLSPARPKHLPENMDLPPKKP